jgi:PAS domain S-box-containing protein
VTQRKKIEESLKENEEKLRKIIDTSPDAIVWTDIKGEVTLVNKKGVELTGFSKNELLGQNFMDVKALTQESKERILESFMKRIQGVDTPPYEVEVIAKNGEIIPTELSASAICEGDRIAGTQSIFRDLRERKKMEEKLKEYSENLEELVQKRTKELLESEKRYSVLVEEARDGVAILQDAKFVFANNRLPEILGYSKDELIGMPFLKLADEKYRQLVKERYERRLRGEKVPATYEAAAIDKNDQRVPIELSAARIDYQGRPADLVIVRDIRERKQLEIERLKLERLAAIGKVATMVGHDLRNPLQSIENAIYYLNNELPHHSFPITIPQKAIEMLQIISNSVNYADKIVRDLHDFSGTKKPAIKKIDINAVVEKTLSQLKAPKNVKVITELGHLPEIDGDKEMMKRVFMNLALNAIQAIEKGGKLEILAKETKGFVEVSFKDTGVGMSKENIKKLFTPFFTTKAKGMGMGLAICKRFVDAHNGSIEVKSEEGKGSTFTVKLPIQRDDGGEKR